MTNIITNTNNNVKTNPLMQIPVPWVYAIAYLVGAGIQLAVPISISSIFWRTTTQVISIILLAAGIVFAAWAQWIFHREHTTTDPNQTSTKLITIGPYRFSRNPMYVGLFLTFIGLSGIFTLVWSIICQLTVFYYLNWVVIPYEETQLQRTFGETYRLYCKKARRWL